MRPSGRWAVEIKRPREQLWPGTFNTSELAAREYDAHGVWQLDDPRGPLNFREEADFFTRPFEVMRRNEECQTVHVDVHLPSRAAMAKFRVARPEHVEAEL
jgi:hypothetical protein